MDPLFSGRLSLDALMKTKALKPLSQSSQEVIKRIESFDVTTWNEDTVREEIVSPLLGVLGYDILTDFSIERDKAIKLPGRNKYLDYGVALWSRSFWLIETKSPKKEPKKAFSPKTMEQAVFYAAHPEVNAALIVLCDGRKLAVYDREEDLIEPILLVRVSEIGKRLDHLRLLLEPWQVWLFEKRRIARHIDRIFDREFNAGRLEEFRDLISEGLDRKQRLVLDNMRKVMANADDPRSEIAAIESSHPVELVEGYFLMPQTRPVTEAIARTLAKHCERNAFPILHRIFPEQLRSLNDHYCVHALNLLLYLHAQGAHVHWLPEWLGGDNLETAIRALIQNCLTLFANDPERRAIVLYAAVTRRLCKLRMVLDTTTHELGTLLHAYTRHVVPEDDWAQLLSTPGRELLLALDGIVAADLSGFLRRCSNTSGTPTVELLEAELQHLWVVEREILERATPYWELVEARGMREFGYATEQIGVKFDWLAHGAVCVIDDHPTWKKHVLHAHPQHVKTLARMGSSKAQGWLDGEQSAEHRGLSDQAMADRFFLGDVRTYQSLRTAYKRR